MKMLETLVSVKLQPGEILLNDDQVRRRKSQIKETKQAGVYRPLQMLNFKAGEQIGVPDGFLTKRELEKFKSLDEEKAETGPAPKPAKKPVKRTKK